MKKVLPITIILLFAVTSHIFAQNHSQDVKQKAHSVLKDILNSREFAPQDSSPSWLSKFINRFLEYLPNAPKWAGKLLEWIFYLISALIVISVFFYISKYFRKFPSFKKSPDNLVKNEEENLSSEILRDQAYEYFHKGEYRLAIRYIYKSLLLHLDRIGLLVYETGKTDGQYVREFSMNSGNKAEEFAALTTLFERKWYGPEKSRPEDFQKCENILRRLELY